MTGFARLTLDACEIRTTVAVLGGGIYADTSTVSITNSTIRYVGRFCVCGAAEILLTLRIAVVGLQVKAAECT